MTNSRTEMKGKAKMTRRCISERCTVIREHYSGIYEEDGMFWCKNNRTERAYGYETQVRAERQREASIAFEVLKEAGIEDAHEYDWHLWADSAEKMVSEIIKRDKEMREARSEVGNMETLVKLMSKNQE